MKTLIGYGIFSWSSTERQSNRYGGFFLSNSDYENRVLVEPSHEVADIRYFLDKRVRLACEVVESRDSGHVGDHALGIKPSRPEVGEIVDLGVGVLALERLDFQNNLPAIVLKPGDLRDELWIDPRKVYRLHDQTIRVYVEETEDDFTPVVQLTAQSGVIANGDGSFQAKRVDVSKKTKVVPKIERLGDGRFSFDTRFEEGEKIDLI